MYAYASGSVDHKRPGRLYFSVHRGTADDEGDNNGDRDARLQGSKLARLLGRDVLPNFLES
jgi:hypothetical protein